MQPSRNRRSLATYSRNLYRSRHRQSTAMARLSRRHADWSRRCRPRSGWRSTRNSKRDWAREHRLPGNGKHCTHPCRVGNASRRHQQSRRVLIPIRIGWIPCVARIILTGIVAVGKVPGFLLWSESASICDRSESPDVIFPACVACSTIYILISHDQEYETHPDLFCRSGCNQPGTSLSAGKQFGRNRHRDGCCRRPTRQSSLSGSLLDPSFLDCEPRGTQHVAKLKASLLRVASLGAVNRAHSRSCYPAFDVIF